MSNIVVILILVSVLGVGYGWRYPRNADQAFWAFRTCQRIHSHSNNELVKNWLNWILPLREESFCYVKCCWILLGSYNASDHSIKINTIKKQFKSRNLKVPPEINYLKGSTDGSCREIYNKTIKFFVKYKTDLQEAYYGTKEILYKWYEEHPKTKPLGTKISEFCKQKKDMDECKHKCSFYYYRLVDEDDMVISFTRLPTETFTEAELGHCRQKAESEKGCRVSLILHDCLADINQDALKKDLKILDDQSEKY